MLQEAEGDPQETISSLCWLQGGGLHVCDRPPRRIDLHRAGRADGSEVSLDKVQLALMLGTSLSAALTHSPVGDTRVAPCWWKRSDAAKCLSSAWPQEELL